MTSDERLQSEDLITRLRTELEFVPIDDGEWIIRDDAQTSDGINGPEFLPNRIRIPMTGDRLELGVHKVDLAKYLELGRISGEPSQDADHFRHFWPQDSRFTVSEDDDWIFVSATIEPTPKDLERQYASIGWGLEVTLAAALRGKTYEEMKTDTWCDGFIEEAETVSINDGAAIFPDNEEPTEAKDVTENDDEAETDSGCPDYWDRSAENLVGYRIESWDTSVGEAATALRLGNKNFIGSGIGRLGRIDYKDERGSQIKIHDFGYVFDEVGNQHGEGKRWRAELPIGEAEIKTVADMVKLTHLTLQLEDEEQHSVNKEELEMSISVLVEDHQLVIESADGEVSITFFEPACSRCEIPIWKFEENITRRPSCVGSVGMDFDDGVIIEGGNKLSGGMSSHRIGKYQYGKRSNMCCEECFGIMRDEFAAEFPLSRKENALAAVRAKLDEIGYPDVQLEPSQVWPSHFDRGDDIEIFAFVDYERDGRQIRRRAGVPTLSYDGKISPNMPSREYVEFR